MVCLKVHILFADDGSQGLAGDQASSPESPVIEALNNLAADKKDDVQTETPVAETEIPSTSKGDNDGAIATSDKNGSVADSNEQTSIPSPNETVTKGFSLQFCFFPRSIFFHKFEVQENKLIIITELAHAYACKTKCHKMRIIT